MNRFNCLVAGYEGSGKTAVIDSLSNNTDWNFIELPSIERSSDSNLIAPEYMDLCKNISVIVFVMQRGRILEQTMVNYRVLRYMVKNTPILLVVTSCENDNELQEWPNANEKALKERGMLFDNILGGCFIRTGRFASIYEQLYSELVKSLSSLLENRESNIIVNVKCPELELKSFMACEIKGFTRFQGYTLNTV